jgi:hypothetical protein
LLIAHRPVEVLQNLHSGQVADYVTWIMTGMMVVAFVGLPAG